jgi:hypothetical protein
VVVSAHVATGAAAGVVAGGRLGAVLSGLTLHAIEDAIPHRDISSRRFELWSGLALLGLVALTRGPFDPATVGAAACASPDLEHLLPMPTPGGRKLFPSHRVEGWHREGGIPAWVQLVGAGVIVGLIATARKER